MAGLKGRVEMSAIHRIMHNLHFMFALLVLAAKPPVFAVSGQRDRTGGPLYDFHRMTAAWAKLPITLFKLFLHALKNNWGAEDIEHVFPELCEERNKSRRGFHGSS
jgi:hypothetical protein